MNQTEDLLKTIPYGPLALIPLKSFAGMGERIDNYLVDWRRERKDEYHDALNFNGYQKDSYIIPANTPRFGSGEAKGVINASVRGDDLYLLVDVCNYSLTYSLCGMVNHGERCFMKKRRGIRNDLKQFALGIDFYGLALFGIVMVVNLVAACIPAVRARFAANNALDVVAIIFEVFACACLIFVVRNDEEAFHWNSPLVWFTGICIGLYYIAWIYLFCHYLNTAVYLFLAIFPCVALVLFEIERRNWIALCPTAVFAILHIISACIHYI